MSGKKKPPKPKVRCPIYTRKSTEEGLDQEYNSFDAQRDSAEAYIASQKAEGWTALSDRYDDGGFTDGNMERPALDRLRRDIERGKVDCVVVCADCQYTPPGRAFWATSCTGNVRLHLQSVKNNAYSFPIQR